jgi:hypothetical protein
MAKVITFSRFFPAYHPRKGEPTYFVEKIWAHLISDNQFDIETCEAFLCGFWCEDMFSMKKVAEYLCHNTPKIHGPVTPRGVSVRCGKLLKRLNKENA